MTTIEERHKIAERLRMRLANWSGMGWRIHIPEIGNGVWMENHGGNDELEEAAKRLADLVEPSCDRDALLALADEMDAKSNDGTVNPDPMKPIASSLDLFGYARRIREAVGA